MGPEAVHSEMARDAQPNGLALRISPSAPLPLSKSSLSLQRTRVPLDPKLSRADTACHPESVHMSLILCERSVGPITLLEFSEQLITETIPELRDTLEDVEVQGRRSLLFDCSRIRVVDSQGIRAL